MEIALASQSPRRRELLDSVHYEFRVYPVKVSEIIDENLNPQDEVIRLAILKAQTCVKQHKDLNSPGFLVLGADTIVVLGARVLGKPENYSKAQHFLRSLSGKTHSVMTGMCLLDSGSTKLWSGVEQTQVTFRELSESEIRDYIASGEPMDKAGAYAIQGEGGKFVSSYTGSWSNVVGLPLERLEEVLKENGWTVGRRTPEKS